MALTQLLTRGLPEIAGHLAYAGIFGYFIGLAVMRRSEAPRLLLLGWLSAAALHGAWDAACFSERSIGTLPAVVLLLGVAIVSYLVLASAILKARKISPTRSQNFAAHGDLIALPPPLPVPQASPPVVRCGAGAGDPDAGRFRLAPAPAPAIPAAPARLALVFKIGPVTRPIVPGLQIEPKMLGRHGAGRGKWPIAEVIANPQAREACSGCATCRTDLPRTALEWLRARLHQRPGHPDRARSDHRLRRDRGQRWRHVTAGRTLAGDLSAFAFYVVLAATWGGAISETKVRHRRWNAGVEVPDIERATRNHVRKVRQRPLQTSLWLIL